MIVPPVPTPAATKWVILPSVSRQISRAGGLVMARRAGRVGVLVGLPRAGNLAGERSRNVVVAVGGARVRRRSGIRLPRRVGAQHITLVLADLVGQTNTPSSRAAGPPAPGRCRCCRTSARRWSRPARAAPPPRRRHDHLDHQSGPGTAARVGVLDLGGSGSRGFGNRLNFTNGVLPTRSIT